MINKLLLLLYLFLSGLIASMVTGHVNTCIPMIIIEDSLTFDKIIFMPSDIGFQH